MTEQEIKMLSDDDLLKSLEREFEHERRTSHVILLHLLEVQRRRLYADRGYPRLFDMLIKHFKLAETSAYQRLHALDIMTAVPAVQESLVNGEVNLTTIALAQRQILREEKISGRKIDKNKKAEVVASIINKTQAQAEVELFRLLPQAASAPAIHERRVSADATRVSLTLPDRVRDKLLRLRNRWAHVDASMDYIAIIERAADIALAKVDRAAQQTLNIGITSTPSKVAQPMPPPAKNVTANSSTPGKPPGAAQISLKTIANIGSSTSTTQSLTDSVKHQVKGNPQVKRITYYPKALDTELWTRANSQCEYVDSKTGRRCDCTFGLERDHIVPLALGGTNELSNLRLLCKTHNLMMARRHFGAGTIDQIIGKRRS